MNWNLFKKSKNNEPPQKTIIERGDFKNDFAFLEYLIKTELISLTRNINILEDKEKIGSNTLFINDDMMEKALESSVLNISSKISDSYKTLLLLYFKDEEQLLDHIVTLLMAYSIERIEESNTKKINKKRYQDALASISQKKKKEKSESNKMDAIAGSLPDTENIEIPEVL